MRCEKLVSKKDLNVLIVHQNMFLDLENIMAANIIVVSVVVILFLIKLIQFYIVLEKAMNRLRLLFVFVMKDTYDSLRLSKFII